MRLILVGGGLANSLIAHRLAADRPDVDWTILEAGEELGGNHTWSFHAEDLSPEQQLWMEPFVAARWPGYAVAFPTLKRRLPLGYRSASAERMRAVMAAHAGRIRTGVTVSALRPDGVTLATGEEIRADAVIDGRGFKPSPHLQIAFQKFYGIEVRTAAPHGQADPIIMDATVPQRDGFRFVYTLPFTPDSVLIEDTYYSDGQTLDRDALLVQALDYARRRGWTVADVLRDEAGVLPIALGGDIERYWADSNGVPRSGLRAALFHATTGYSLPDAVRLADRIAALGDLRAANLHRETRAHSLQCWRDAGFYRLLDRLLFKAAEPDRRYSLIERFYHFSPDLVSRFYAGRSTLYDKARVLTGKPPVPIFRALRCLREPTTLATAP
ncbi:lycopene beta-cyclase CrtY [Lichenibacterium dinghuense]|uniref:lycopene beta-cyclase CrtY n=1 Tax=Lichenibacterium dinghuense TaxID=2895977 RepID=UPI001F01B6CC|nr:lycopene beta-cyclase CrtY [Lichenibacterium sp. 6Y81]